MKTRLHGIIAFIAIVFLSHTNAYSQHGHKHGHNRKVVKVVKARSYNSYHYGPRRGYVVRTAPAGAVVIKHNNINYHYHRGIFYRPGNAGYVVSPAPFRARVHVLPIGYRSIRIQNRPYYYYYGTYYAPVDNQYEIVEPPIGATVDRLPDGAEKLTIDGMTYFVLDNTYYKEVQGENGEILYEVTGKR